MTNPMIYAGLKETHQAMVRYRINTSDSDTIIDSACKVFNVGKAQLLGSCRKRELSDARRVCYKLIRDTTGLSYPKIGAIFGKKHSTVMCAVDTYNDLYAMDKTFREKVDQIKRLL